MGVAGRGCPGNLAAARLFACFARTRPIEQGVTFPPAAEPGARVSSDGGCIMRMLVAGGFVAVSFLLLLSVSGDEAAAQGKEPKYTISEVMKVVHNPKKGILGRVLKDTASKADKDKMVEMYESLAQSKPPGGDVTNWKKRTADLVSAAKQIQSGDAQGITALKTAVNCKTCH